MSAKEFTDRLVRTTEEIAQVNAQIDQLKAGKDKALMEGDDRKAVALNRQTKPLQEQLEDLTIAKAALEAKLRVYEQQIPVAAEIRKRLGEELWPQALELYENLKRIQGELRPVLEKITALNAEMDSLAHRHNTLIGDSIYRPMISVPLELMWLPNVKLEDIPNSLDLRLASERERGRLESSFREQRPVVSKLLKLLNMTWPVCPTCGAELLAYKYELAADESRGFANFRCPKHSEQTKDIVFPPPVRPPLIRGVQ
jgi:DNA repair exonuclease SbcCD ATPase subunit